MHDCQHSYVVRNILGANRFLCKECWARFLHHPGLSRVENQGTSTLDRDIMAKFREGFITFEEAIKGTNLSDKEFLEAVQIVSPPMVDMIFDERRTSCPKEIEDFFGDPDVTTTDVQSMFDDKLFPDIVEVSHDHSIDSQDPLHDPYRTSVTVTFIDYTEQLVYLYPKGHIH